MEIGLNSKNELNLEKAQNNFLNSTMSKVINTGIDIGLRAILPDFLENQIIDIKNIILENGFKAGLDEAITTAVDIGKSTTGIVTGEFENINQIQNAVKKGGIIDSISNLLDKAVNLAEKRDLINSTVSTLIKKGKNTILEQVTNNIEESLTSQIRSVEKLDKYCGNWKNYFENKDFEGMEREYKKMKEQLKNIIPIEKTIKETRNIENLHNLIKNNGKDFNLSEETLELAKQLA